MEPDLQRVERIEIRVLVDNVTDSLSSAPPFVTREWTALGGQGMRIISGDALCCANHGFSVAITAYGPVGHHTLLFDGGPVDYAVERNGVRLGVDFGAIEAIVLSHGHWDHAGGIPRALGMTVQGNGGVAVPLYLHPRMFNLRGIRTPKGEVQVMQRVLRPDEWSLLGAEPIVTQEARLCLDRMFYVSGEIPRITSYEKGFPGHVCQREVGGSWEPDEALTDERFVAVHIHGKGLVVFSSCSHAGIINVLHHARSLFPGVKLYAVMGGFHLSGPNEMAIARTVEDLNAFDLELVIPGHCTGWRAVNSLASAFGDKVVPSAVGQLISL
jgi:7,8-dihydropterin-6-yl-methyl-4-(beta-D-ribofuranosyl)aminobenzene 5'-phosphate synthase